MTCGITFTFGGLRITPEKAAVVSNEGVPIRGLYAAGEIVGGLFFHNYPGGTGLTAGSVFGRIAGEAAAEHSGPDDKGRPAVSAPCRLAVMSRDVVPPVIGEPV